MSRPAAQTADLPPRGIEVSRPPGPKSAIIWVHLGPYHLARAAAARGLLDLTVIELARSEQGCGWRSPDAGGLNVITLGDGVWERQPKSAVAFRIWRALNKLDPEVLFIAGYSELPCFAAALWSKLRRRRSVLLSDSTRGDRRRRPCREFLKSLLLRAYDRAIAAGTPQADYLVSLGFDRSRIGRPYDVVDNEYFSTGADWFRQNSGRRAPGLPENYFLFVGRLCPQKNLPFLVRSFARYRAGGGDWDLVLVGDGDLRQQVLGEAARAGVQRHVHLRGARFGGELVAHYAFAGCLVLPSVSETWGLVVNEAMASALPVLVSSQCGSAGDLVSPGVNGFVFNPCEEPDLAESMRRISGLAPAGRQAMGRASSEIIRSYSLDSWALALYRAASNADQELLPNA